MARIGPEAEATLRGLASGDQEVLGGLLAAGVGDPEEDPELDARVRSLVSLAALIAVGAPQPAYTAEVAAGLSAGATVDEMIGVLAAVAPRVGAARVMGAAPELIAALGLSAASEVRWPAA